MFGVTFKQSRKVDKFKNDHSCTLDEDPLGGKQVGAIGGRFTYSFTPTDLGEILVIKCACGAEQDLTEYNDW